MPSVDVAFIPLAGINKIHNILFKNININIEFIVEKSCFVRKKNLIKSFTHLKNLEKKGKTWQMATLYERTN